MLSLFNFISRQRLARMINVCGAVAGVAVAWQIVRFYQGEVDAPGFELMQRCIDEIIGVPASDGRRSLGMSLLRLMWGISAWATLSTLTMLVFQHAAAVVERGLSRYLAIHQQPDSAQVR